jgi:hypothetical protein
MLYERMHAVCTWFTYFTYIYNEGEAKKKAIEALVKPKREKVSQKMETEAGADEKGWWWEDEDMDDEEKIRIDELLDG